MKQEIMKTGFSLLGKYVLCLIMSLIIVISFLVIFSTAFSSQIGYTAYTVDENGVTTELYTHYLDEGEDTKKKEYEDKGVELQTINLYKDFEGAPHTAMLIISQICTLGTFVMLFYSKVYYIGDSDANKVAFNRITFDILKGAKLGIIPSIIPLITFLLLVLGKLGIFESFALVVYRLANYHIYSYNQLIFKDIARISEVGWGSIAASLLSVILPMLVCEACYLMGYKRINIFEKLVYKKKKG